MKKKNYSSAFFRRTPLKAQLFNPPRLLYHIKSSEDMAKKATKELDPRFEVLKMLTVQQKDKLLLKLFRKDPMLVEKLAFEFFEDKSDLVNRRNDLKSQIDTYIHEKYLTYDTPGEAMMVMRSMNGRITEHVKITKDKYGEVELTILLLNTAFTRFGAMLEKKANRADTFSEYVIKRTLHVLKVLEKLHEDNYLDFKDDLNQLLNYLHTYRPTIHLARDNKIHTSYFIFL